MANGMLFGSEELNTSRQFEFDMAKALCIFEMVLCHCFEELLSEGPESAVSPLYYLIVVLLDCVFAGGTFMGSTGLGIAYSRDAEPEAFIRRGSGLFLQGYSLNLLRFTLPDLLLSLLGVQPWKETVIWAFSCDVLQFAGLAMLLLGLLKKAKLSDLSLFLVALGITAFRFRAEATMDKHQAATP